MYKTHSSSSDCGAIRSHCSKLTINVVLCQYRYTYLLSIDVLAFYDGYRVVVYICSEPFPCSIASFAIDEHLMFLYIHKLQNVLRKWFTFNSMASVNVIVICWNCLTYVRI